MSVQRSRWPTPVIVIGIFGGMSACGVGVIESLSAIAWAGCSGGGCEARMANDAASAHAWLVLGLIGGLALVTLGGFGRYLDRLRARGQVKAAPRAVELTEARVVSRRRRPPSGAAP